MALTRRGVLRASGLVAGAGLAGCTGGSDTDSPDPSTTATGGDPTVAVRSHPDLGDLLVDDAGMTLYAFEKDAKGGGSSACNGGCADSWPPLTGDGEPTAGEGVSASLSTFEREDGTTQVAANGWPLYYFGSDESPGDVEGQGVGDAWWVLGPDGTVVRGGTPTGTETDDGYY